MIWILPIYTPDSHVRLKKKNHPSSHKHAVTTSPIITHSRPDKTEPHPSERMYSWQFFTFITAVGNLGVLSVQVKSIMV